MTLANISILNTRQAKCWKCVSNMEVYKELLGLPMRVNEKLYRIARFPTHPSMPCVSVSLITVKYVFF
jgi:hypothetical protein